MIAIFQYGQRMSVKSKEAVIGAGVDIGAERTKGTCTFDRGAFSCRATRDMG
jgi:hypothetical protein